MDLQTMETQKDIFSMDNINNTLPQQSDQDDETMNSSISLVASCRMYEKVSFFIY